MTKGEPWRAQGGRSAAHGDLESPEPGLIYPRREAVGVLAAPASARPATMGRKLRRAAALQIEQPTPGRGKPPAVQGWPTTARQP